MVSTKSKLHLSPRSDDMNVHDRYDVKLPMCPDPHEPRPRSPSPLLLHAAAIYSFAGLTQTTLSTCYAEHCGTRALLVVVIQEFQIRNWMSLPIRINSLVRMQISLDAPTYQRAVETSFTHGWLKRPDWCAVFISRVMSPRHMKFLRNGW